MKAILWITALVLAIPTFGISLVVALVLNMYMNKQEGLAAAQVIVSAASSLKNDIVNKYDRLRAREGLSSTDLSDNQIFNAVMTLCQTIESTLEQSGRFHNDKDEIIQLAVRLASYAEDFTPDDFQDAIAQQLSSVKLVGVTATLRKPYKKHAALEFDDDDIPFWRC